MRPWFAKPWWTDRLCHGRAEALVISGTTTMDNQEYVVVDLAVDVAPDGTYAIVPNGHILMRPSDVTVGTLGGQFVLVDAHSDNETLLSLATRLALISERVNRKTPVDRRPLWDGFMVRDVVDCNGTLYLVASPFLFEVDGKPGPFYVTDKEFLVTPEAVHVVGGYVTFSEAFRTPRGRDAKVLVYNLLDAASKNVYGGNALVMPQGEA